MSDHTAASATTAHSHVGRYLVVWAALMALTALTWGLSTIHVPGLRRRGGGARHRLA